MQDVIYLAFWAYIVSKLTGTLSTILRTSHYDLKVQIENKEKQKHPHSRIYRQRPSITILIVTQNDEKSIDKLLQNIRESSYRKYDIQIIDNASVDNTVKIINKYLEVHPTLPLKILRKRKQLTTTEAFTEGLKKWDQGEIIFMLTPNYFCEKDTLKNIAFNFSLHKMDILVPYISINFYPSFVNTQLRLESILNNRSSKANLLSYTRPASVGIGSAFSRKTLENPFSMVTSKSRQIKPKQSKVFFAANVILHKSIRGSYKIWLNQIVQMKLITYNNFKNNTLMLIRKNNKNTATKLYQLILCVWSGFVFMIEPWLVCYFVYMAVVDKQTLLLGISWLLMSSVLAIAIWSDNYLKLSEKLSLSLTIPLYYALFYPVIFIRFFVVIISFLRYSFSRKIRNTDLLMVSA
ncbi:MAG: hypothetical protein NVS1B7_6030 [Candidatus Saccharimonadales bacterium]